MRFFSDGPSIPDLLLERRDQGRVVFLCGAGVSCGVGMPNFVKLTEGVINYFNPSEDSEIVKAFAPWIEEGGVPHVPLDQIFHLLHQEYVREEVNEQVSKLLSIDRATKEKSREHLIIERLSTDSEGNLQIVTTNFDLLFEQSERGKNSKIHVPPGLPDLNLGLDITGITYLHGRICSGKKESHAYVLSSADFGRAYLSEAWATKFVQSLLKNYTVVLLGYRAEDPPVKYLLQGLNQDEASKPLSLYAFDRGTQEEIESKWRDRGVTAIAYNEHEQLWDSLEAWAEKADDPREWRSKVLSLAQQSPRELEPFQRGQVVHLLKTNAGAKAFSELSPTAPAEWLCVFDPFIRYKENKGSDSTEGEKTTFSFYDAYALDDDSPLFIGDDRSMLIGHDHILLEREDNISLGNNTLRSLSLTGFQRLSRRLIFIANWIASQVESPCFAWWVLQQYHLHPNILEGLRRNLRDKQVSKNCEKTWTIILDYLSSAPLRSGSGLNWIWLQKDVKKYGWSYGSLSQLKEVTTPYLKFDPSYRGTFSKLLADWTDVVFQDFGSWSVHFSERCNQEIGPVPKNLLPSVFQILESNFQSGYNLQKELEVKYFDIPTCYPERDIDGDPDQSDEFFSFFQQILTSLVDSYPKIAHGYALIWENEETSPFTKLKLFLLKQPSVFDADHAMDIALTLGQKEFWGYKLRRELLFFVSDRWSEFSDPKKDLFLKRVFAGPDDIVDGSSFTERICILLKWLLYQGCCLEAKYQDQLDHLCKNLPKWNDNWCHKLTTNFYGRAGSIVTDESTEKIDNLPIEKIAEAVKREQQSRDYSTFVEKEPFQGLVKSDSRKALAVLSHESGQGRYSADLWSTMLRHFPLDQFKEITNDFLYTLLNIPSSLICDCSPAVESWFDREFTKIFQIDKKLAWQLFDCFTDAFGESAEFYSSPILETCIQEQLVERSRQTYEDAINAPIGRITRGVIRALNFLKLKKNEGIPSDFQQKIEKLFTIPGKGQEHAISILAQDICWLYSVDRLWVEKHVIPWFSIDSDFVQPAWSGFLSSDTFPPQGVAPVVVPLLIEILSKINEWEWESGAHYQKVVIQMIVECAIFGEKIGCKIDTGTIRDYLRLMDESLRKVVLSHLVKIGDREENGWEVYVIPFIENTWPLERIYRTKESTLVWVSILEQSGDSFPQLLDVTRKFLSPLHEQYIRFQSFYHDYDGKGCFTARYPADVLDVLDLIISQDTPHLRYQLPTMLADIIKNAPHLSTSSKYLRLISLVEEKP